jgi:hypothetical protein
MCLRRFFVLRFEPYQFEAGLWPPNASYEQTHIFLLSCAAAVVAPIVFSKGAPYRKALWTNGIMFAWIVAAVVTVIFMSLFKSDDFASRLNFKISPSFEFQLVIVAIMVFNCAFCYVWEVSTQRCTRFIIPVLKCASGSGHNACPN